MPESAVDQRATAVALASPPPNSASQAVWRTVWDVLPTGICVIDGDGRIIDANQSWLNLPTIDGAARSLAGQAIGSDYRDCCIRASALGLDAGNTLAQAITAVSTGESELFSIEYNVPSCQQLLWFAVSLRRLPDQPGLVCVTHANITQRKHSDQQLVASRARLASVIDNAIDSIICIDAQQRIVIFNPAAEKLFGHTCADVIGRELNMLLPKRFRLGHTAHVRAFAEGRVPEHQMAAQRELFALTADGREVPIEASISHAHDGSGVILTVILRDISERKRNERALQHWNEELEARVRQRTAELETSRAQSEIATLAKSQFVANMSHELRTPMNAVLGMAHLALENAENPRQRQYIENIQIAGHHLLGIVNEVLDFSKIEAGKMTVDEHPFRCADLVQQLDSIFSQRAEEKSIALSWQIDPALDGWLWGDSHQLGKIIINFVTNALKFTEHGSIKVRWSALQRRLDGLRLRVEVEDSGIGIDSATLGHLFHPFEQADKSTTRKFGGTGLGLAICQQLAELMGGAVGATSIPGHGSTFWLEVKVSFPDCAGHEAPARDSGDTEKAIYAEMRRLVSERGAVWVLVVDDNAFNREIPEELLRRAGIHVVLANDGQQALAQMQQRPFDAVLMDIQMPVMDGLEATRQLRANPALAHLPVIAMTANAMSEDIERYCAAGIEGVLRKPLVPAELYQVICQILSEPSTRLGFAASPHLPGCTVAVASGELAPALQPSAIEALVGRQPDTVLHLAEQFLQSASSAVSDMEQACASADLATLAALGHRIKSSARAVGASQLADYCERLERLSRSDDLKEARHLVLACRALLPECSAAIAAYAAAHHLVEPTATDMEGIDVVIVDDDTLHLELLASTLNAIGISRVQKFTDQHVALQTLQSQGPALLICDLNMSGMDGVSLLHNAARNGYEGGVIILSGVDDNLNKAAGVLARAYGLNLLATLRKPAPADELRTAVRQLGHRAPSRQASSGPAFTLDRLQGTSLAAMLDVVYQPKVQASTGKVLGCECLARLHDPVLGIIGPGQFIPLLESEGRIDELTLLVFERAATQLANWQRKGYDLTMSVNLSMENLQRSDLPELFEQLVHAAGVAPASMMLELTESRPLEDLHHNLENLARLRLMGFGLSIDDFGTGFSSMENLRTLPFTELKIDRSFVGNALTDKTALAILEYSIHLGKVLHLNIVAEGVESAEEWALIADSGCDEVQGYWIARPMHEQQFSIWMADWQSKHPSALTLTPQKATL